RPPRCGYRDRRPSAGIPGRCGRADAVRAGGRDHRSRPRGPVSHGGPGLVRVVPAGVDPGRIGRYLTAAFVRGEEMDRTVEPRYPRVVLASVCIPWSEHGQILEDVFREQVALHLKAGVKHIYVFGTAGEGYA